MITTNHERSPATSYVGWWRQALSMPALPAQRSLPRFLLSDVPFPSQRHCLVEDGLLDGFTFEAKNGGFCLRQMPCALRDFSVWLDENLKPYLCDGEEPRLSPRYYEEWKKELLTEASKTLAPEADDQQEEGGSRRRRGSRRGSS